MEDLEIVFQGALRLPDRMSLVDAFRIIKRNDDQIRRDLERKDAGDAAFNSSLASNGLPNCKIAMGKWWVAAVADCRCCADLVFFGSGRVANWKIHVEAELVRVLTHLEAATNRAMRM